MKPRRVHPHDQIRIGRSLGMKADDALDIDKLNKAQAKHDPTHPGYVKAVVPRSGGAATRVGA